MIDFSGSMTISDLLDRLNEAMNQSRQAAASIDNQNENRRQACVSALEDSHRQIKDLRAEVEWLKTENEGLRAAVVRLGQS